MTTLRVGMRVRLVRPTHQKNYGITGVIAEFGSWPRGMLTRSHPLTRHCDCGIDWDNGGSSYQHTSQLEPILDPGAQPSEYATLAELLESLEVEV